MVEVRDITFVGYQYKNREELFSYPLMARECVRYAEMMLRVTRKMIVMRWQVNARHVNACHVSQYSPRYYSWRDSGEARCRLSDGSGGCCSRDGSSRGRGSGGRGGGITVDLSLRAVPRDVAGLAATVASLAGSVQRSAVGSGAVAGDVAQFAAGVALHCLGLAITSKVVGSTALVAGGRASAASETATETSSVTTTGRTASSTTHSRVGAVAGKVASDTAAVAASACASSAQAQSWAVSLDVSKTLAVVALLGLGSAGMRASVGLVAWLLAVVAQPLRRGANLGVVTDVSALEARTTR